MALSLGVFSLLLWGFFLTGHFSKIALPYEEFLINRDFFSPEMKTSY